MPVTVQMPDKKDPLEKLANAVSIAKNVYGIYADSKQLDQALAAKAEDDKKRKLEIDRLERDKSRDLSLDETDVSKSPVLQSIQAQLTPKGIKLPANISGREALSIYDPYLKPKSEGAQKDPTAQMLASMRLQDMINQRGEKDMALQTPYGKARSLDDAKQLKDVAEQKASFDRKMDELIQLRQQYGGEVLNRSAVARAKQLSKDLLLSYKNMAKLGVLSKSDEDIINAIIPTDPLEFSPSAVYGDDPVLTQLTKFKTDMQADFENRLANRLTPSTGGAKTLPVNPSRGGDGLSAGPATKGKPAQIEQNGHTYYLNPKTGQYE